MITLALIGALLLVLAAALYDYLTGVPATRRRALLESRDEHTARLASVTDLEAYRAARDVGRRVA